MLRRLAFISFMATTAFALDKQGSAHGGAVGGNDTSFNFSGALMAGVSLYNPSYAARPDNTGLALFRYAAHFDVDLIGRYLSVPLDVSFFTDATRMGGEVLLPTEFDFIGGITSTFAAGPVTSSWARAWSTTGPSTRARSRRPTSTRERGT